jgi:arsenite methyltransferase
MEKQSQIKDKVKEQYGKIALMGDSGSCCNPSSACCGTTGDELISGLDVSKTIGYNPKDLDSIPESSVLGLGCGNPTKFAYIREGDAVVDLGSGADIDVFLVVNIVKDKGKVIGIDMTENMLDKARQNAQKHGYKNVEFRKGDIETEFPVESNSADVVISNCVINLTESKVNTFKEIYRVLKPNGIGRMVISDLVTSKEIDKNSVNVDNWCSCIDGALTKENYVDSIKQAGFTNVEILDESPYTEIGNEGNNTDVSNNNSSGSRKITSLTIKAVKD